MMREVNDLERVLEDVLPVARAEAEPAHDLHELLVVLQFASKTACSPAWTIVSSISAFDA